MRAVYENLPPLFDLTFRGAALFTLLGIVVNIFIIYFVLRRGRSNPLTRAFCFFIGAVTLWGVAELMIRLSASAQTAAFWIDVGVPGWIFMAPLFFSFALAYTGRTDFLDSYLAQLFTFGPGILFLFWGWNTDTLVTRDLAAVPWGWNSPMGMLFPVFIFWTETYFMIGLWLLGKMFLATKDRDKRMQILFIGGGLVSALIMGSITDAILPIFGKRVMGTAIMSTTVTNLCIAYAILRYKLFVFSPASAISSLIPTMNETLIVLDPEGFIELTNPALTKLTGYGERNLLGAHIRKLFPRGTAWDDFYRNGFVAASKGQQVKKLESAFIAASTKEIPVHLALSPILSPTRELIGVVIVAHDVSRERTLIQELKKTEEELRLAKYQLEKRIGEVLTQRA